VDPLGQWEEVDDMLALGLNLWLENIMSSVRIASSIQFSRVRASSVAEGISIVIFIIAIRTSDLSPSLNLSIIAVRSQDTSWDRALNWEAYDCALFVWVSFPSSLIAFSFFMGSAKFSRNVETLCLYV
jgi:hypothetical protein